MIQKSKKIMAARIIILVFVLAYVQMFCLPVVRAEAASAKVQLSAQPEEVAKGDYFYVVCTVSSEKKFCDVEIDVLYDAAMFQFVRGGSKVRGGEGALRISSTGNSDEVTKRTFSLQFKALEAGTSKFDLGDSIGITNAEGENFSVSSNMMTVRVVPGDEGGTETYAPTPTPLSTVNSLKSLSFNCISMTPEFSPDVLEYTVKVDSSTDVLYFSYTAGDRREKVRLKNNTELVPGENRVKVEVAAESGAKRVYKLTVVKESRDETRVREQMEKGASDITFSVYEKDGSVFIQNQYQFQVVDVEDEEILPSGYVKTSFELEGRSVPAYTMENDLENNYLLMYLKGAGGEPTLYQYDRQEKTLQRYTGTMVQKVNQGGNVADEVEVIPNAWLYAAIIGLMVVVLALLIIILNMVLRRKFGKGKRELDDLDF